MNLIKICADFLRAHLTDNHNIKLKPTHAHELVAAYFGYTSNAALRAERVANVNNLSQGEVIVMVPDSLIDQRRKELRGLPSELPDSYTLGEAIYSPLFSDKWWKSSYPPFRSFEKLARFIFDNVVKNSDSFRQAFKFHKNILMHHLLDVKAVENDVFLIITHCHEISTEELSTNGRTIIKLPRVAGHIAYGNPQFIVERHTGGRQQTLKKKGA